MPGNKRCPVKGAEAFTGFSPKSVVIPKNNSLKTGSVAPVCHPHGTDRFYGRN